ncbi:MAG: folate family ECF transporter S component [Oscillospiraceae bacterium]|nr:folate family ECF transporter S component [Oscillospiraceae bacterium]MBR6610565.1 folate family ECF transporter S component [Oscillospiraceae bacterium]
MKEYWKNAAKELKSVRAITGAALFAAMSPILALCTIQVNQFLQIGFTSLTHAMTGYFFGPLVACMSGGIADIIKYMLKPNGPFFPGFTINEMLVGFIYGMFFYKRKITLPKCITARFIVTVGINLTLTPLWLSFLYGNAFKFMVPTRIIKNIIMIPVDIFLLHTLLKFCEKNRNRFFK